MKEKDAFFLIEITDKQLKPFVKMFDDGCRIRNCNKDMRIFNEGKSIRFYYKMPIQKPFLYIS